MMDSTTNQIKKKKISVKEIAIIGMLSAIAYVIVVAIRIPIFPAFPFLKYEAKDVAIAIGGLIWGPLTALIVSILVAFFELISISSTGPIGMLFNIVASVMFTCVPAMIYKKNKTIKSAIFGLVLGAVLTIITMLLWNYIITPIYTGMPREVIAEMIPVAILPFNLIKYGINAALVLLLYKPVIHRLKSVKSLHLESNHSAQSKLHLNISVLITAFILLGISLATYLYFS